MGKTGVAYPDAPECKAEIPAFKEHLEKQFHVDVYVVPKWLSDEPKPLGRTSLADIKNFSIPENAKWFIQPVDESINDEDLLLFLQEAADSGIRGLSLRHCRKITNAGLAHLKNITWLKSLDLSNTEITDASLAHFKNLISLESLDVSRTQITDAGLTHLKNLTSLKELYLVDTNITDAGLKDLRTALPDVNVLR